MTQKHHYRKRPVTIKGELEETETEFLLHIRPVSNAKSLRDLRFTLSCPKEGIEQQVNTRDVIYGFLVSSFGVDRAQEIIQQRPLEFWNNFIRPDGNIDTQKVRAYTDGKEVQNQGMEASTSGGEPERSITAGLRPHSTTTVL